MSLCTNITLQSENLRTLKYEQLQGTRAHGVGTTLLPPTRWDSRMEKITALDQHMPAAQRRTQTTRLHWPPAHFHTPTGEPYRALPG